MRFVKPLDSKLLHKIFRKYKYILTVEDGCLLGDLAVLLLNLCQIIIIKTILKTWYTRQNN